MVRRLSYANVYPPIYSITMNKKPYQKPALRIVALSPTRMLAQSPKGQPNAFPGAFSQAVSIRQSDESLA